MPDLLSVYRFVLLTLCLSSSMAYSETVYKCTDAQGNVTYSGEPCPDGKTLQLDVNSDTRGGNPGDGLRAAEKEMLKSLEESQPEPTVAEQPQAAQVESCSGIDILSVTARTYAHETMGGGRNMAQNHCVLAVLGLGGRYYGKLNNENLQQDIKQRFYGTFADGSTQPAQSIKFSAEPDRVKSGSQYEVLLCFGNSEFGLLTMGCR